MSIEYFTPDEIEAMNAKHPEPDGVFLYVLVGGAAILGIVAILILALTGLK